MSRRIAAAGLDHLAWNRFGSNGDGLGRTARAISSPRRPKLMVARSVVLAASTAPSFRRNGGAGVSTLTSLAGTSSCRGWTSVTRKTRPRGHSKQPGSSSSNGQARHEHPCRTAGAEGVLDNRILARRCLDHPGCAGTVGSRGALTSLGGSVEGRSLARRGSRPPSWSLAFEPGPIEGGIGGTMRNALRFDGLLLSGCECPEWYRQASLDEHADWDASLQDAGAQKLETYGAFEDSIQLWRTPDGGYMAEYWNSVDMEAVVFIDELAAYFEFRARYLFPWAWLVREMERRAAEKGPQP